MLPGFQGNDISSELNCGLTEVPGRSLELCLPVVWRLWWEQPPSLSRGRRDTDGSLRLNSPGEQLQADPPPSSPLSKRLRDVFIVQLCDFVLGRRLVSFQIQQATEKSMHFPNCIFLRNTTHTRKTRYSPDAGPADTSRLYPFRGEDPGDVALFGNPSSSVTPPCAHGHTKPSVSSLSHPLYPSRSRGERRKPSSTAHYLRQESSVRSRLCCEHRRVALSQSNTHSANKLPPRLLAITRLPECYLFALNPTGLTLANDKTQSSLTNDINSASRRVNRDVLVGTKQEQIRSNAWILRGILLKSYLPRYLSWP